MSKSFQGELWRKQQNCAGHLHSPLQGFLMYLQPVIPHSAEGRDQGRMDIDDPSVILMYHGRRNRNQKTRQYNQVGGKFIHPLQQGFLKKAPVPVILRGYTDCRHSRFPGPFQAFHRLIVADDAHNPGIGNSPGSHGIKNRLQISPAAGHHHYLQESSRQIDGNVSAKAGFGTVLSALLGINISGNAETGASANFNTNKMVRNIVKNTILTDFLAVIREKQDTSIKRFCGYKISAPKESLTYVALISPYLSMVKGGTGIPAGDFNIAVEKLDNTLKTAKGYYEFLGTKNSNQSFEQVIFRFNIDAFRNNYKAPDLMKMDITIYAIYVGRSSLSKLNFDNEFDIESHGKIDNPVYTGIEVDEEDKTDTVIDVYDVLLAGVEIEDKKE